MAKDKKKKNQKRRQILDCYGIEPEGKGKITFGDPYQDRIPIMKSLGEMGKW